VYGNSVIRTDGLLVPDLFINFIDGKYLSCVFHKQQENVVFDGGQLDRLIIYPYFLGIVIDGQSAAFVNLVAGLLVHVAQLGVAS